MGLDSMNSPLYPIFKKRINDAMSRAQENEPENEPSE